MAKKSKNSTANDVNDLKARARYPIGLLFQVSTLAACISYVLFSISGHTDVTTAIYRSLVVFIGVSVCFGILLVSVITVLHKVKMQELEEKIKLLHEEQLAEQQLQEAQQRQAAEQLQQLMGQPMFDGEQRRD